MKRTLALLIFTTLFLKANAQYWEVGVTSGASSYIGDLQPNYPATGSYGLTYGALARLHYRPHVSFKATAISGFFYGTDRYAQSSRRYRNLESQTQFYELAATAEWNIAQYNILDSKTTSPYLFAGIAGMYFNPQARGADGQWVDLQPLGTEGQTLAGGKAKYSKMTVAIPFGVGLKMAMGKKFNFGIELGFRQTFTDYLDDVSGNYPDLLTLKEQNPVAADLSFRTPQFLGHAIEYPSGQQRGDKYKYDMYFYVGATITYNLANSKKMEFNSAYRNFLDGDSKTK